MSVSVRVLLVLFVVCYRKQKHQLEKEKKLYLANQEKLENSEKANLVKIEELQKQIHDVLTIKVSKTVSKILYLN